VAELKDNINQMIANLRDTTQANAEQDWLKTNLARISGLMQGQRDLLTVARMIMSELTPTVSAQHGAFFMAENGDGDTELRLIASYGYKARKTVANKFKMGEALVGQAALEKKTILITQAPSDYIKVTSGLGEAAPVNVIVVPITFEDQVLAVIELAALRPFSEVDQSFLDQLVETIGVVLNTIIANMRTEELLQQSQRLTGELQSQSEELQTQQEELQQRNEELEEKAALLAEQNRDIEVKNHEIELARRGLEEKAEQLALSSKYKSEFLANMSHELRTPLNSLLILAKLLSDNAEENLSDKQVEFARTIYASGNDLLALINDILDLSKVEAGKMDVHPAVVEMEAILAHAQRSFLPVAEEKGLEFGLAVGRDVPPAITTDEQRLHQVLKNLLSNAFKFTEKGRVELRVEMPAAGTVFDSETLRRADQVVAFVVEDTGIGIAPDKMRVIFESFQQADGTTSRKFGGTGLGLSISREIARLLGGEIRLQSEVGKGSLFTLYLPDTFRPLDPVVAAPEPEPVAIPPIPAPAEPVAEEADVDLLLTPGVDDDRAAVEAGDRMLLTVGVEPDFVTAAVAAGRSQGFKVLATNAGERAVALARQLRPDAIVLDTELPDDDGLAVLSRLKRQPETRHIPVQVVSPTDQRQRAHSAGALGYLDKPASPESLEQAMAALVTFLDRGVKQVLVVEDDETERNAIAELIGGGEDVEVTTVGSSEEAVPLLEQRTFDCMVLDLKLPGTEGFELLEKVKTDERFTPLPVIIYTGKALTRREETRLRKYAETVIVKDVRSPERLLDETALYLHRMESRLPSEKRRMIEDLHTADAVFQDKKVLIVDDDVRNVFALTSALEARGMSVLYAENGADGLELLKQRPDVDLVLMDIMMPEMDGYETTRAIRKIKTFKQLPIIALTAKAMKGDREKSIAAGASDYITKPVDIDQVLSLMRVWLYR
jgi:signal transduction histidine kinase/CheY-like chemotaxis protein